MPIRFRCAYCNQLMGISKRKAGTVVRCPTCSGQVVVPNPDAAAPVEEQPGERAAAPNLFERSDFDDVLRPGGAGPAATVSAEGSPGQPPNAPVSGAWGTSAEPPMPIERIGGVAVAAPVPPGMLPPAPAAPAGLVLTSGRMTVLAVVFVLMLGVAFGAGVLVGKFWL